jgi:nucleotide-binding universal stress UspA family protein
MATARAAGSITDAVQVPIRLEPSMPNPIVVGVDPERQDGAPLHLAAGLARIVGAPLIAVASFLYDPTTHARSGGMVDAALRVDAAEKLEALAAGFDAELAVIGGPSPARVLHDAAVARSASMLVVGSTHRGPLGRLAPGATAERLLHGAPCPVAIATSMLSADWTPSRVGVGFIDLDEGHEALRAADALAHAAGASLHALTAIEPLEWSQSAVVAPYRVDGRLETSRAAAQRALDAAIGDLPSGIHASTDVVVRHAVDALIALSVDVELLVCGSRGYGPLRSVLLGTVTHRLTHAAHCPVVVIPRGAGSSIDGLAEHREATAP